MINQYFLQAKREKKLHIVWSEKYFPKMETQFVCLAGKLPLVTIHNKNMYYNNIGKDTRGMKVKKQTVVGLCNHENEHRWSLGRERPLLTAVTATSRH